MSGSVEDIIVDTPSCVSLCVTMALALLSLSSSPRTQLAICQLPFIPYAVTYLHVTNWTPADNAKKTVQKRMPGR